MPPIHKNTNFTKPTHANVFDYHKADIGLSFNHHAIGTIESFNPTLQTAKATINYQKVILSNVNTVLASVLVPYPPLVDCPVHFEFSGKGGFTHPPQSGDECEVHFNDRDFDLWWQSGQVNQAPISARLHAFPDAIITVGIRSMPKAIASFDSARPAIRNFDGSSYVAVGIPKIKMAGNGTTLNTALQNLISTLESLTVNTGTGIPNPPFLSNLAANAAELSGFLE